MKKIKKEKKEKKRDDYAGVVQKRVDICSWQLKKKNKCWEKSEPMNKFSAKLEEEERKKKKNEKEDDKDTKKVKKINPWASCSST